MNIKANVNMVTPLESRVKTEASRDIKFDQTADRDANGQMPQGEDQAHQEPLTDEEVQEVIAKLKKMPAVEGKNLIVKLLVTAQRRFILIQEPLGKIVRRIPETEFRAILALDVSASQKGQLLNKDA